MTGGFRMNKDAIRNMSRAIEDEFAANPVRIPLAADPGDGTFLATSITNNYHGPVVTVHGDHAQLAWENQTSRQTQKHDIAPGYEALAKLLTGLMASLPALGLSKDEADEAKSAAGAVLGEVVKDEPDRSVVRRGVTLIKGLLAPMAAGVGTAVSGESAELAKTVIEGLGSTLPF